jgi:hypothetical protein
MSEIIAKYGWELCPNPPYSPDLALSDLEDHTKGQQYKTDMEGHKTTHTWMWNGLLPQQNIQACTAKAEINGSYGGFWEHVTEHLWLLKTISIPVYVPSSF